MHIWWQSYTYFKNKKWYCALNWLFQNKVNNHFYSLILFPVQWQCILFITYGEHFYFYINQSLYGLKCFSKGYLEICESPKKSVNIFQQKSKFTVQWNLSSNSKAKYVLNNNIFIKDLILITF